MNNGRWCTKKDVLQDLAKATGRRITNIDNNYFVVGENPPPPLLYNDEEGEMLQANDKINYVKTIKPDLKGISQMLCLVKEHSGLIENVDVIKICSSPKTPCDIISISKLNPNVKEFIPKCFIDKNLKEITAENKIRSEEKLIKSNCKEAEINKDSELKSIKLNCNDTQAIANALKNKITQISASRKNTFQAKKERNVALANLQKLYTVQPNQNVSLEAERPVKNIIKLITPDFFENSKADVIDIFKNKEQKELRNYIAAVHSYEEPVLEKCQDLTVLNKKNDSLESLKTIDRSVRMIEEASSLDLNISISQRVNGEIKEENTFSDSEVKNIKYISTKHENCNTIKLNGSDPQIQNSIKKVKNWLSKADKKPKGPVLHLGPVSFKRKDVTNRQSPNEIDKKIPKPSSTATRQYIPTKYASELSNIYMERMKNKEIQQDKVSWENLNTKLREKDELMKKSKTLNLVSSTSELSANVNSNTS